MKKAKHAGRSVFVVKLNPQAQPGEKASRTLKRFRTVRQAEKYIGEIQKRDPEGVYAGAYAIDAPEPRRR
jgi:hypothetical protein